MTRVYANWLAIFSEERGNWSCWTNPGFCLYGMSVNEASGSDCICLFNVIVIFIFIFQNFIPLSNVFKFYSSSINSNCTQIPTFTPSPNCFISFFLFQQHKAVNYCFAHKHGYIEPRAAGWARPWRKLTLHPQKWR